MDINDMIYGEKKTTINRYTIKQQFDNILNNCPSNRRVRRFIRDWLNDLDEEKKIKMLNSIFG